MSGPFLIYNSHALETPVGTITSYLGTSDPDGWVICDGQLRTVTDNRFENIYGRLNTMLGVTSNTANSVTPPDLRSRVIYGASTTTANPTTGGSANVTLAVTNLPAHSHNISYKQSGTTSSNTGAAAVMAGVANSASSLSSTTTSNFSITNTGSGTAFSVLPPYYTLNYILKY
jgi:microcystin-dependent protein